jgi:hypothetical protein
MLVKLLTPVPPTQVQVFFHATVVSEREVSEAQLDPEDAPDLPHWSRRREYWFAVTLSQWPVNRLILRENIVEAHNSYRSVKRCQVDSFP